MTDAANSHEVKSTNTEEVEALRREVAELRNALSIEKEKQQLQTEIASLKQELSSKKMLL